MVNEHIETKEFNLQISQQIRELPYFDMEKFF